MKTAIGVILAAVLAAGAGAAGSIYVLNTFVASVDQAAENADPADLRAPAEYDGD
jgi:hypothetical protein